MKALNNKELSFPKLNSIKNSTEELAQQSGHQEIQSEEMAVEDEVDVEDRFPAATVAASTSSVDIMVLGGAPVMIMSVLLFGFFIARFIQQKMMSNDLGIVMRENERI